MQVDPDKTLLTQWDSSDHYDENLDENQNQFLRDDAHDQMIEDLDEWMREHNPDGLPWHAEVTNFGWRNQNGYCDFSAHTAQELLWGVLPNTENTFVVYDEGDHISINNAHHDSPMGGEWYTVKPQEEDE
jgi:hypothetical protein